MRVSTICSRWIVRRKPGLNDTSKDWPKEAWNGRKFLCFVIPPPQKKTMYLLHLTCVLLYWRILRPGFFMENFDGTIGRITAAVLRSGLKPNTQVQLVVSHSYLLLFFPYLIILIILIFRQLTTLEISQWPYSWWILQRHSLLKALHINLGNPQIEPWTPCQSNNNCRGRLFNRATNVRGSWKSRTPSITCRTKLCCEATFVF